MNELEMKQLAKDYIVNLTAMGSEAEIVIVEGLTDSPYFSPGTGTKKSRITVGSRWAAYLEKDELVDKIAALEKDIKVTHQTNDKLIKENRMLNSEINRLEGLVSKIVGSDFFNALIELKLSQKVVEVIQPVPEPPKMNKKENTNSTVHMDKRK